MTTLEIRLKAINLIDDIITLKANVVDGCYSDKAELDQKMTRLEGIKNWAVENNELHNIKHYFASHNFGQAKQFAASEISNLFYN